MSKPKISDFHTPDGSKKQFAYRFIYDKYTPGTLVLPEPFQKIKGYRTGRKSLVKPFQNSLFGDDTIWAAKDKEGAKYFAEEVKHQMNINHPGRDIKGAIVRLNIGDADQIDTHALYRKIAKDKDAGRDLSKYEPVLKGNMEANKSKLNQEGIKLSKDKLYQLTIDDAISYTKYQGGFAVPSGKVSGNKELAINGKGKVFVDSVEPYNIAGNRPENRTQKALDAIVTEHNNEKVDNFKRAKGLRVRSEDD